MGGANIISFLAKENEKLAEEYNEIIPARLNTGNQVQDNNGCGLA